MRSYSTQFNQSHIQIQLPWAIARWATKRPTTSRTGTRRPLQSVGNDLGWQIEVIPQKLNAIVGQIPVIVHPSKCLPHILLGFEALHELDDLQVRHIYLWVLRKVVILLCVAHALCIYRKKLNIYGYAYFYINTIL